MPLPEESHEAAFEIYYSMGRDRSLAKLQRRIYTEWTSAVPSYHTLKIWAKEENWRAKVVERDIQEANKIKERIVKEGVEKRANLIDDVYTALTTGVKDVKINTPQGLKAAVDALTKLEQVDLPHSTTGVKIAFEMVDGRDGQKAAAVAVIQEQKEEANKE